VKTIEGDVCILGAGIAGALVAARLAEAGVGSITVVDAGRRADPAAKRPMRAERWLDYMGRPWPGDRIAGKTPAGAPGGPVQSPTMYVGGQATHWTAQTPRFTPEDFRLRSLYGYGRDWPISYDDLEPYYGEAERRIGVCGEPDGGPRSSPFPMPPVPESVDLTTVRTWAGRAGLDLHAAPYAKNSRPYDGRPACVRCDTCYVCPTGAKYSPDETLRRLVAAGRVRLLPRTAVRRLEVDDMGRVVRARAIGTESGEAISLESPYFILATGHPFAPHLLARSATPRYPRGLANSSGTLGRFIQGHPVVIANLEIPDRLFGWVHEQNRLMSRRYMRTPVGPENVRFDLSLMAAPHLPYLRDHEGRVQFGDELMDEWRRRSEHGVVQIRALIDVYFGERSRIVDDPSSSYPWGDPMPKQEYVYDEGPEQRRQAGGREVRKLMLELAERAGGHLRFFHGPTAHPHRGGGCRMGHDPSTSVCDSFGRTHDHENLFVAGAPLLVTGGCTNATLTFSALALRTAERVAAEIGAGGAAQTRAEPA